MVVNLGTFVKVSLVQMMMCVFTIMISEMNKNTTLIRDQVDYILDE